MVALLVRQRLRSSWNGVRDLSPLRKRVGAVLFCGSVALFTLLLVGGHTLFVQQSRDGADALDLLVRRVSLFLFVFLLAGGVPFVSGTLLAPGDLTLLAAAPARPSAIVAARLGDSVIVASGQLVVIGLPLLVAAAWALKLTVLGWIVFAAETLLLLCLPVFLVAVLLLSLVRVLGARRVRTVVAITSAALSLWMCLLTVHEFSRGAVSAASTRLDASALAALRGDHAPGAGTARSEVGNSDGSVWQPWDWVADTMLALGSGSPARAVTPFLFLLGATVASGAVCIALGGPTLVGERLLENDGGEQAAHSDGLDRSLAMLRLAPPTRALVAKDLRCALRDLILLSQVGVPLILFFVPFVIGGQLGNTDREDQIYLALGVVGMIAYMEASILSLTSVGLEGRSFWIVLTAPVSAAMLIRAKWSFAAGVTLMLTVPLILISCAYYAAPPVTTASAVIVLCIACLALSGYGVGVSGMFPRFVYDNPAHRASLAALIWGFVGGTLYLVVCACVLACAWYLAPTWAEESRMIFAIAGLIVMFVSSMTALLPLLGAERRLRGMAWEE
jgi:ABC-2 type transport system permease protein